MNYDLTHLKSTGLSDEKLKATFEKDWSTREKKQGSEDWKVNRLIDLHATRIEDGVRRSLHRARTAFAIEKAYDAPRDQISYTLVRDLISRNVGGEELQSIAKGWGLDQMLIPATNESGQALDVRGAVLNDQNAGKPGYKLHLPTFYNVLLPMVMAYVKIRWAKLFSDRDQYPLLKYEPTKMSSSDLALSRVITARIQRMVTDMGYKEDVRQSILSMLLHSFCLNFPLEAYWREEQIIKGKTKVVKEGVRWFRPHPTKVFYDQAYPLHTINSDTGCEYMGYWSLRRWGDVFDNKEFWNRKQIGVNKTGWRGDTLWKSYQEMYPCAMKFPSFSTGNDNDRENKAFLYSTANDRDSAVDVTVMFHKLIPKEWGLGTYEHPVWMRFVYAGERTCIYVEPMAYVPAVAYMYDFDENRENNSSLALELVPFQDHLGHLISQYLLTVKKNLIRVVAVDSDIVDQDFFKRMSNGAENALRGIVFMKYSSKQLRKGQQDVNQAFQTLRMHPQNATELIGAINTVLGIVERLLGFSAQEVGSAAKHQQSANETSIIASNSSIRLGLTSSGIDSAIHAFKKALYQAFIAYGSDEVAVQVAELSPKGIAALEKAGLKLEQGENSTFGVTGKKAAIMVEEFSSDRDGLQRINEPQAAQLMLTLVDRLMVPQFMEAVGIDALMEMIRVSADQLGIPSDFIAMIKAKVKPQGGTPEEQAKAQQEFIQNVQQIVQQELVPFSENIKTSIVDPLGQTMQQMAATSEALDAVAQAQQQDNAAIGQIASAIERLVGNAIPAPGAPIGQEIPVTSDSQMTA